MLLLLTTLWPALIASLVLGAAIGWLCGLPRERPHRLAALGLALAALVLGAMAVAGFVPGRPGFWVESVALNLAAYLAGTTLGGVAAAARNARPVRT